MIIASIVKKKYGEIMQKERKEFLEAWADTKETCGQIEALLHIIKNYCEVNDDVDRRFFYIEVLLDIILYKNYELNEQINKIETFQQCL